MRTIRLLRILLGSWLLAGTAAAQSYVEIRQDSTRYNFTKTNGAPLSATVGDPVGSDGRIPGDGGGQTINPATANQFQGVLSFGGLAVPANPALLNTNLDLAGNAGTIGLPVARDGEGAVVLLLRSSRVGSPFLNRAISFQFGSVIPVPEVDENGALLTNTPASSYWLPEPFSTNGHAGAAYYWSKHARAVFAIQPGPVDITWRKAVPGIFTGADRPADYGTNAASYYVDGANYYKLHPVRYIASGSAVKPAQQIYWTEGVFADLGKPVDVPAARVSTVNVVYNNNFPEKVARAYVAEGETFITDQTNLLQEVRTLWHDSAQKQIHAYNREGRVFVELLGDTRPDGRSKEHLGFEIVDVVRQANPADVTTELGGRLAAFADGRNDDALIPEPVLNLAQQNFTYEQTVGDTGRRTYFATRETVNQNDVLIHWMQVGVQSIRWPSRLVRYRQVWPADYARYSHYIRPRVDSESEARLTAIPLPNENVPTIEYQDPFDRPRANLTEQFALYTFLDAAVPAHRTLLRLSSGEYLRFERVFSWLDANLKATNFAGSVAMNLTSVQAAQDYPTRVYPGLLADYTNYLAARSRGVNGDWKLHVADDTDHSVARNYASVAASADGTKLAAVVDGGSIHTSADAGVTWIPREADRAWKAITSSGDGRRLAAVVFGGQIFTSTDSGNTWANREADRNWAAVASSADGTHLVAAVQGGQLYISADAGETRAPRETNRNWSAVASSSDGTHLVAAAQGGQLHTSADAGETWTPRETDRDWVSVAASANGATLVAADRGGMGGRLYVSTDSGVTWTPQESDRFWAAVGASADGATLAAVEQGGQIYTSMDAGMSWTPQDTDRNWISIAVSADGTRLAATERGGSVRQSSDGGATWSDGASGFGTIASWELRVITQNAATSLLATNVFGSSGTPAVVISGSGAATPSPSTVTVSGIADAVISVQVALNGFAHTWPEDVDAFLVGPRGNVCALLSDAGGSGPGLGSFDLLFADEAPTGAPQALALTDGPYRPTDHPADEAPPPDAVGSIGTSLAALLLPAVAGVAEPPLTLAPFPDPSVAPRVVRQTVDVGERVVAPTGELGGSGDDYVAGYLLQSEGDAFNPGAYQDPFVAGFDAASRGAIIPVNAIPGRNALEVWWFRKNSVDGSQGFKTILWPSVIGHYAVQWPASSPEIVLASNDGSGALGSLEAGGRIYRQNDAALPGYNPNEEHALMLGGQAYALRDDLNRTGSAVPAELTGAEATYSSHPFVLLDYTAGDGRPAMTAFKVLREKPEAGILFDYVTEAGQLLQAPMPLPFLPPPVDGTGDNARNYNVEPAGSSGDLPPGAAEIRVDDPLGHYGRFTFRDRKEGFWVYRGLHAGLPELAAGTYDAAADSFLPLSDATGLVDRPFAHHVHASRRTDTLVMTSPSGLPSGLTINGLSIAGIPSSAGTNTVSLVIADADDGSRVTNSFQLRVSESGAVAAQGPLTIVSSNSLTGSTVNFTGRPPYLATSPVPTNSFTMRFYYRTQAGFDWPGINPPEVGTIVPYLRPADSLADPATKETPALDIVYRPTWPASVPRLAPGQTLTVPTAGLPAVRGQSSLQVLYQQSLANDFAERLKPSVRLHDPTREKSYDLESSALEAIPAGVRTDSYQGKAYFPGLPPHLAQRLFFDPARGSAGQLVFKGEFKDEQFGEKYLLLNVLGEADLGTVKALCPVGDADKAKWDAAVEALAATVETYHENPAVPGSYVPDPAAGKTVSVGITNLVEISDQETAVDSYALSAAGPGQGYVTLVAGDGRAFTPEAEPVSVHIIRVGGPLYLGELKVLPSANPLNELLTLQHTGDLAARTAEYEYDWRIAPPVDGNPLKVNAANPDMTGWNSLATGPDMPRYTLGGAGIQVLVDNYLTMRYRPANPNHPLHGQWSAWTAPQLAEGWIKRVLAGINPFNQRVTDLFNNAVNTDAGILTQAGKRWEGDVALNLENINNYGLIEIYETVLRRGKALSIDSGINFGPANDALLLAAGYLNDLYLMHGNEAFADAANPTIGIGTADNTYGDISTALFAFKGQVASLLDEELALLRGRDEFLQPGTEVAPVYNRLVWNYTRGIDAGEVIYALNYNILDQDADGAVGAADAAKLYPQGHGDAYGHYLTALKGYYSLLMDTDFDWVPRIEAVTVLGKPVSVDYQDERKFAAAAAAVARTGRQIFDLTWRADYPSDNGTGWEHFARTRAGEARTRHWGMDHWAARTGQGAYLNWLVGNAILPDVDPDPTHEGIQKVDRTTVPELDELPAVAEALQTSMDHAAAGLTPLGLPESAIPFDLNPNTVAGTVPKSHFEQVDERARMTLRNALAAFDEAKDVTRLMRSEGDSLADFQAGVARQELAYTNALIEIYGTPYPEDVGPGQTYRQGYAGPDLIHYMYVQEPLSLDGSLEEARGQIDYEFKVQKELVPGALDYSQILEDESRFGEELEHVRLLRTTRLHYTLNSFLFPVKPESWTGRRRSPGEVQTAVDQVLQSRSAIVFAHGDFDQTIQKMERQIDLFRTRIRTRNTVETANDIVLVRDQIYKSAEDVLAIAIGANRLVKDAKSAVKAAVIEGFPKFMIAGMAFGTDAFSAARASQEGLYGGILSLYNAKDLLKTTLIVAAKRALRELETIMQEEVIEPAEWDLQLVEGLYELEQTFAEIEPQMQTFIERHEALQAAQQRLDALIARGERLQGEREVFRQRAAAVVQGFRTRDAAFRIFRSEKLERYKTLFDLAARYSFMAAQAYDYETGQLGTAAGKDFVARIIRSRALGLMKDGEPQYAGSNTGDPGLSSALAEMSADWQVLRGRLGFNNPDAYGTTVSLREENLRILPGIEGDTHWKDVLHRARRENLLDDADVKRHCLQIDPGDGLPVPGLVLEFGTTITGGENLFGRPAAPGDHGFSPASFATKIFSAGIALEGYRGMDDPVANAGAVSAAGSGAAAEPSVSFLDADGLFATPYIYLIPVGVDAMRSPPLGDTGSIRTWNVDDVTIPLPFNLGASDFSSQQLWQSGDSLTEPLFGIRKHQPFRPVSTAEAFESGIYSATGLARSQFTNTRLIGRSVWNTRWKVVIPGQTLLSNPDEGLDRFIRTVKDIKLHLVTYSYSGN